MRVWRNAPVDASRESFAKQHLADVSVLSAVPETNKKRCQQAAAHNWMGSQTSRNHLLQEERFRKRKQAAWYKRNVYPPEC